MKPEIIFLMEGIKPVVFENVYFEYRDMSEKSFLAIRDSKTYDPKKRPRRFYFHRSPRAKMMLNKSFTEAIMLLFKEGEALKNEICTD